jgi:hypothetical protein
MFELSGKFHLQLRRDGELVEEQRGRNLVTDLGENLAANRFADVVVDDPATYLGTGSGTSSPVHSDEDLLIENGHARQLRTTLTAAGNETTGSWEITFAAPYTITEMGIFNDETAAQKLIARFLTQEFSVTNTDVLTMTWVLQFKGQT